MARTENRRDGEEGLSHEEYVTSLYRAILRREPDDAGLLNHVSALHAHGDHARILKEFLKSREFLEITSEAPSSEAGSDSGAVRRVGKNIDAFDTKMLIESSRDHFENVDFIESIKNRADWVGRARRKISTIAVYYPKMSNGGTERVTSRQILAWIDLGYRVILLTDSEKDTKGDYFYGDVERFIIPPKMMHNHDYRMRGSMLAGILTSQKVDVFVNNLWDETSTVWDALIAKSLGIPVIVGWHNIFDTRIRSPGDLHLANMRFSGYKYADLVTVLSTVDRLWFRNRGVAARVVHNPMTFDKLPEQCAPLDGKTVVWVARAERHQKRLDLALRMFPLVLQKVPDATLLIVGGGPDLQWAKTYARALGIGNRVVFTGYTTDVAQYLARADVHILTSEFEGWCLALGEAWAYGLPTVMFDLPYLEYVQGKKGFIPVPMHDISAMADAVSDLLLDGSLRKKLGREARATIEEFAKISFKEVWRKIFVDIETLNDLDISISREDELRGLRALTTVLADRLLTLNGDRNGDRHHDNFTPVLPGEQDAGHPRKKITQRLLEVGKGIAAPYMMARRSVHRMMNRNDRQLRMIDLSHVGLGDNIMIWTGLFTLLSGKVPLCAPGCVLHVQPPLADMASRLFAPFGIVIQRGRPEKHITPIYTPLPPTKLKEWWRAYVGHDWYMNWVEALDEQKTFPRNGSDRSLRAQIRLAVSERFLYRRYDWTRAMPGYIGYRAWLPVAQEYGIFPLMFLSEIKRSLEEMRKILSDYVDAITPERDRAMYQGNAAFPTGKSFQTISPAAYIDIEEHIGKVGFFDCYIQKDSPWSIDYENNGISSKSLSHIEDTLRIIKYSKNLLTTDSFTSHVAQLIRDDFVLVLSRDLEESVVHPGAHPQIVANHPACAPCNYQERYHFDRCVAGYKHCIAFESDDFISRIADHFRS